MLLIRRKTGRIRFEVADGGVGIEPERTASLLKDSNSPGVGLKRLISRYGRRTAH